MSNKEPPSYGKQVMIDLIGRKIDELLGSLRWVGIDDAEMVKTVRAVQSEAVKRILAACVLLVLTIAPALAHMDGASPELNAWMMRQHNRGGIHCCDGEKDAHFIQPDDIRAFTGKQPEGDEDPTATLHHWYDVRINGKWYPVFTHQLVALDPKDPPPIWAGIIWYSRYDNPYNSDESINIFCLLIPPQA